MANYLRYPGRTLTQKFKILQTFDNINESKKIGGYYSTQVSLTAISLPSEEKH